MAFNAQYVSRILNYQFVKYGLDEIVSFKWLSINNLASKRSLPPVMDELCEYFDISIDLLCEVAVMLGELYLQMMQVPVVVSRASRYPEITLQN